jgi:UDPglucose 6-dehydrogenase
MKIGIIGAGILGKTHADWLLKNTANEVLIYDIDERKSNTTKEAILKFADVFMLCVPTDQAKPGSMNEGRLEVSTLYNLVAEIDATAKKYDKRPTVFIRSTVPVGYTRRMSESHLNIDLYFVPEFLTEKVAVSDFAKGIEIIGTATGGKAQNEIAVLMAKVLEGKFFPLRPNKMFSVLQYEEAELVKLATNSFYALKVTFANELSEFCEKKNIHYHCVKRMLAENPRIGSEDGDDQGKEVHLRISQDGKKGYGGKCLPKDSEELANEYADAGIKLGLLKKVVEINKKIR